MAGLITGWGPTLASLAGSTGRSGWWSRVDRPHQIDLVTSAPAAPLSEGLGKFQFQFDMLSLVIAQPEEVPVRHAGYIVAFL